jgi:hypothetical protein
LSTREPSPTYTLHATRYTLTLHTYTLHPTSYTPHLHPHLHPTLYTLHPTPYTLIRKTETAAGDVRLHLLYIRLIERMRRAVALEYGTV